MKVARTPLRITALLLALVFGLGIAPIGGQSVALAQTTPVHRKNWVQRHPTLTAVGAGIATHHALKVKAKHDKAAGKKLNFAERHPTLTAIGVGGATRHVIKKTTPK